MTMIKKDLPLSLHLEDSTLATDPALEGKTGTDVVVYSKRKQNPAKHQKQTMTQTEPKSKRFLCPFPHSECRSNENVFQSQTGAVKLKLAPNCSPGSQVCKKSLGIYQQFNRPVEKAVRRGVERRVFIWRPAWGNFCLPVSVIETAGVRSACRLCWLAE